MKPRCLRLVRGFFSITDLHGRKAPAFVIGSIPGTRGGAWSVSSGRAPTRDDEVVVGRVLARRHGLRLGDAMQIMGRRFTVVGTGADAFMASFVFMTHAATDDLLDARGTTSFVLVGTKDPAAVRARLHSTGLLCSIGTSSPRTTWP